jgi:O-methyltransferase involved in polyketide biosynthesis
MSGPGHSITHVSDTARWTALHRATESARPDALFRDPLAERLAGERGRAIVAGVAEAIIDGCDRVLNLAAGLEHPAVSFGSSV